MEHWPVVEHYEAPPIQHGGSASGATQVVRALRKRFLLGAILSLVASAIAVVLVLWKYQPYYQAEARIEISPIRPRVLYRTEENAPSQRYASFVQTQVLMLQSDEVMKRCADDSAVSSWTPVKEADDRVRALRDALAVQIIKGTNLVSVSLQGPKPNGLGAATNAIIEQYMAYVDARDTAQKNRKVRLIEAERDKLSRELQLKTQALSKARATLAQDPNQSSQLLYRDPFSVTHEKLLELQTEHNALQTKQKWLKARLEADREDVPVMVLDDALDREPEVLRLAAMCAELRRELLTVECEVKRPSGASIEARVAASPQIQALDAEIRRQELQVLWLSQQEGAGDGSGPAPRAGSAQVGLPNDPIAGDPAFRGLATHHAQLRQELASLDAQAAFPQLAAVRQRIEADPQFGALKSEIARREVFIAYLTAVGDTEASKGEPQANLPADSELVASALTDNPEAQRLLGSQSQMRQSLAALKVTAPEPSEAAIRERLEAEPEFQAIKNELVTRELDLAKRKITLEKTHPLLRSTETAVAELRKQVSERETELRKRLAAELQVEMDKTRKQRMKELEAQLASIGKQIRPYCERALSNGKALLGLLRKRLAAREAELRIEVTRQLCAEAAQRAQDLRSELAALEKRLAPDRKRALARARESLTSLKKQRLRLEQESKTHALASLKKEAQTKVSELRDRLQSVEERMTEVKEQHRSAVAQHIGDAERKEIRRQLSELDAQLASCMANEEALRAMLKTQAGNIQQTAQRAAELRDLEEDVRRSEEALHGVEQRLHELEVESRAPGYITIASMATEPTAPVPYTSKRIKYGIVGVGLAIGFSLLVVLLLDRRDDRIWSAEDMGAMGQVRLLGCVPNWEAEMPRLGSGPALLCHHEGNGAPSAVGEEMRNLIAGILHSNNGSPARTVLITGAGPGVGSTTVSGNLAACIATMGKRVLLVDANFRKPDAARLFGLERNPGLGNVLLNGTTAEDAVQATRISGLSVLTAGSIPSGYLELLGSRAMADLLSRLRDEYDFVFVDGPPLMLADARMIAPVVDGVVCVFRALTSRRATVRECLETLEHLGARAIGVAVIGVPTRFNGYETAVNALDAYASAEEVRRQAAGTHEQ